MEFPGVYSCCCSVARSSPTLCDPMNCSTPGFPVLHQFLEFAQTHGHWVSDAIPPSHPLSFPSPRALNLSYLLASGGQSVGASALVLPMNIQDWLPLGLTALISKGLSRVFSSTTIGKHQFFGAPSLWSNSQIHTWLLEKLQLWLYGPLSAKWCLCF